MSDSNSGEVEDGDERREDEGESDVKTINKRRLVDDDWVSCLWPLNLGITLSYITCDLYIFWIFYVCLFARVICSSWFFSSGKIYMQFVHPKICKLCLLCWWSLAFPCSCQNVLIWKQVLKLIHSSFCQCRGIQHYKVY